MDILNKCCEYEANIAQLNKIIYTQEHTNQNDNGYTEEK